MEPNITHNKNKSQKKFHKARVNNTYSDRACLTPHMNNKILFDGKISTVLKINKTSNNVNLKVVMNDITSECDQNINVNHMNLAFSLNKNDWNWVSKNRDNIQFYGKVVDYKHDKIDVINRLFTQISSQKIRPDPYPYKTYGIIDAKIIIPKNKEPSRLREGP